jgi:hypothetical protein
VFLDLLVITHSSQEFSRRNLRLRLVGPRRLNGEVNRHRGAIATRHAVGHVDAAVVVSRILVAMLGVVDSELELGGQHIADHHA